MAHINDKLWDAVRRHPDTELGPPASQDSLREFEARFGLVFPPSHREFLLRGNGGVVGYARLFGISRGNGLDLAQQTSQMRELIQKTANCPVFPFANDWGGSYFCFDVQRPDASGEFPVLFWNHEYAEEPADRPMLWSEFASDFAAFVERVVT